MEKIWAHSGDSHFLEPEDLWSQILPPKAAARMPRSEKVGDDEEIVHVDGQSFRRKLPAVLSKRTATGETIAEMSARPPGARDVKARLVDLDSEGIWGEVVYSSLGMWFGMIRDRQLVAEAATAQNEWIVEEIQGAAPDRLVGAAQMPMLAVEDTVAEIEHAAEIGLKVLSLPTGVPPTMEDYHHRLVGAGVGRRRGRRDGRRHSTSGPTAVTRRCTAVLAGRSSTTSRPPTAASGRRRRWSRPGRWTATRTSRCWSPRAARRGSRSSATG